MLNELFAMNKEAFKSTTAKAAGELLMDAILGNPSLTTELTIAHTISTMAAAADKNGAAGMVIQHVAVGMMSNVMDKVIVEIIANGIDVTAPADQQSAEYIAKVKEYKDAREMDTVFSAASDAVIAQPLPADAVAEVTKPAPESVFGTSIQDAMKAACQAKMPGVKVMESKKESKDTKESTTVVNAKPNMNGHTECPSCKKMVHNKKFKTFNVPFEAGIDTELDSFKGKSVCGACFTKLNAKAANIKKAKKAIDIAIEKNSAAQADVAAHVDSMNAIDKTIERLSAIVEGDNDPINTTIKQHQADKLKHSSAAQKLNTEIAARNETIKKNEALLSGAATPVKEPATNTVSKPSTTVKQTSGLNK